MSSSTIIMRDSDTGEEMVLPKEVPVMGSPVVKGIENVRKTKRFELQDPSLASINVKDTKICHIGETTSKLYYRGYEINDIAPKAEFLEVAYLLNNVQAGQLPTQSEYSQYKDEMACKAAIPESLHSMIKLTSPNANPMGVLQTIVSALDESVPEEESHLLIAKVPTIVAAITRHRKGLKPIDPDKSLTYEQNILHMTVENFDQAQADWYRVAQIAHAEHELNASTFATMVIASTQAPFVSAASGAVGALRGPLHGGANTGVMVLLEDLHSPEEAKQRVRDIIAAKGKVSGTGHRVYRADDPRGLLLQSQNAKLFNALGRQHPKLEILEAIRAEIKSNEYFTSRALSTNVDFDSGIGYETIGLDKYDLTMQFAAARIVGWRAHDLEMRATPGAKIIRPRSSYVGFAPRPYEVASPN